MEKQTAQRAGCFSLRFQYIIYEYSLPEIKSPNIAILPFKSLVLFVFSTLPLITPFDIKMSAVILFWIDNFLAISKVTFPALE